MMDYCYLYTLSYNGYVFYIGISYYPSARYRQHCTKGQNHDWDVYNYIYWILESNCLPDIHIIDHYTSAKEAEKYERLLIRNYVVMHHKLCNNDHNPISNKLITCIPDKLKSTRNKVGFAEFVYIKIKEHHNKYGKKYKPK